MLQSRYIQEKPIDASFQQKGESSQRHKALYHLTASQEG